jgi:hypothetical protein
MGVKRGRFTRVLNKERHFQAKILYRKIGSIKSNGVGEIGSNEELYKNTGNVEVCEKFKAVYNLKV